MLRALPAELHRVAGACQVIYESPMQESGSEEEGLLGLFTGCSLLDGVPEGPEDFPVISLFLGEIWNMTDHDEAAYREEVRVTYLHELGHYLGWGEEEIEARGLG